MNFFNLPLKFSSKTKIYQSKQYSHQGPFPEELIVMILEKLSYEEISNLRLVSRHFNYICWRILNNGFAKAKELRLNSLIEIKSKLPRRESERRLHDLYPKHDVLQCLDTRLSLLHMTYSKYMDSGHCCFIPGKVLDEIFRLLRVVKSDVKINNGTVLLREFRDISSMAMEYFEDKTVQIYKENTNKSNLQEDLANIDTEVPKENMDVCVGLMDACKNLQVKLKKQNNLIKGMRQEIIEMKKQIAVLQRRDRKKYKTQKLKSMRKRKLNHKLNPGTKRKKLTL